MAATHTHTLLVQSACRNVATYPSPGAYVLSLPFFYRNVRRAKLVSAEIPRSFYVFRASAGNTSVTVTVGGVAKAVTIPDGNYDPATMAAALQAALVAAFPAPAFAASVSATSNRLTISTTSTSFSLLASVTRSADPVHWGLAKHLGFASAGATYASTANALTGDIPMDPDYVKYLVLDITEFNTVDDLFTSGNKSAFVKLQLSRAAAFAPIVYKESDICSYSRADLVPSIGKLDRLTVRWRYPDGTPVDFNGAEHSFALVLEEVENA